MAGRVLLLRLRVEELALEVVELVDMLRELEADLGAELRWKLDIVEPVELGREPVELGREAEGELGAELRGELAVELGTELRRELGTELRGELEVELRADLSPVLVVEPEVEESRELRLAIEGSTVST